MVLLKSESFANAMLTDRWRQLDRKCGGPMCAIALASLLALACVLHFHEQEEFRGIFLSSLVLTAVLWPCHLLEFIAAWRIGSPRLRERFWCCVFPPLRLAARDHETGKRIWLPGYGWRIVSRELQDGLDQAGSIPMIAIALLVLPLIAIEFHFAEQIETNPRWAACVAAATALIWFAFALEFIVMCSLEERKLNYCLRHWLDLAIILLPLVAFLRALRLGRLLKLQQLTRTARVYRMRGVAMRAWRALLVLEIVRRLIHGRPEQRLKRVEEMIAQKEQELSDLRAEKNRLQVALAVKFTVHSSNATDAAA